MRASHPLPTVPLQRWFVLAAGCVLAGAPAFADDWSVAEAASVARPRLESGAIDLQSQPAYLVSERVPGLGASFAAAIEAHAPPLDAPWRGFGSGAPANAGTAAATAPGQSTGKETGFCATTQCRLWVGVSVAAVVVLIVGHDAADAIGDGLVEALSVAPRDEGSWRSAPALAR